jgi:hypothetical protein
VELPVLDEWLSDNVAPLSIRNFWILRRLWAEILNGGLNSQVIVNLAKKNEKYASYLEI